MSDLISRCELFNKLATVQTLGEAYGIIQEMPTVDAVPVRHGRWIYHLGSVYAYFECSECGEEERQESTFCPHCGAIMDGEAHD